MKKSVRILLGLAILGGGIALCVLIFALKPEAETIVPEKPVPNVEVVTVQRADATVVVPSQGMVHALTATSLASDVSGRVTFVDPRFEVGGIFAKDEVILRIDSADYEAALAQAQASAAKATVDLAMEEGRSKQAKRDWEKLGGNEEASPLALREPQLVSADASLRAANAAVEKAQLDVTRCTVKAPYDCRLVAKHTDIASFVPMGGRLADIESVGRYEVRLPVPLEDFAFIDVSELGAEDQRPAVTLAATVGAEKREWKAEIIRTEGSVERESRSVYLVARVTAEGAKDDVLLQPGLFLRATITGETMKGIIPIPRSALYEGDIVLVVDENDTINRRPVSVLRTSVDFAYLNGGLEPGERVCTTPINAAVEDMKVKVVVPDEDKKDDEGEGEAAGRDRT